MPMTIAVTRDVPGRYRGFLASAMLEIAPGTYVSPSTSAGVRERIWRVVQEWTAVLGNGSVVMLWADSRATGGVGMLSIGVPAYDLVRHEAVYLLRRELKE